MFQTKVVKKTKIRIFFRYFFFRKSCLLWDNVDKYSTVRQVTGDNITGRMRIACWITNATDTLAILNTYCFSVATNGSRKFLNNPFMRTARCLSCFVQGKLTFGQQKVYILFLAWWWLLTSSCTILSYYHTATMLSDLWPYFPVFYRKVLL